MDDHKTMTYTNFQIFLKISLAAMVKIVVKFGPLSILLKFTPYKFFDDKKIFDINSIVSRALFWVT